jgi:uncharacterized cupin superfamily protein
MRSVDLTSTPFRYDDAEPAGFRSGLVRPGREIGARHSSISYYEIPPGEAVCPYHFECGEEEWALPLDGPVWVRDEEGVHRVEPMTLVFFPRGPEGVHQVRNDGDAPVHVLMFGEVGELGATVYPDSDKVGVWTGIDGSDGLFVRSTMVDYFHGEPPR